MPNPPTSDLQSDALVPLSLALIVLQALLLLQRRGAVRMVGGGWRLATAAL